MTKTNLAAAIHAAMLTLVRPPPPETPVAYKSPLAPPLDATAVEEEDEDDDDTEDEDADDGDEEVDEPGACDAALVPTWSSSEARSPDEGNAGDRPSHKSAGNSDRSPRRTTPARRQNEGQARNQPARQTS